MRFDKVITAEDKKMRLPWWGMLWVFGGSLLIGLLLLSIGRFDLARPTLFSAVALGAVIAMRWKLRRQVWFWVILTVFAALHVLLILSVHWTTKWVPAIALAPVGMADLYVMLWTLTVVERFVGTTVTASANRTR